jgi:hypothetical protein
LTTLARLLLAPLGRALGGALPPAVTNFATRLTNQFGTHAFTSEDVQAIDPVLNSRSKVNNYLRALGNAGVAQCIEAGKGPNPSRWRMVANAPMGGAIWLPTVDAQGDAECDEDPCGGVAGHKPDATEKA